MAKRGRMGWQGASAPILPSRVPGVVRALARWAVLSAAAGAGASGCASLDDPGPPWSPLACKPQTRVPSVLANVELARPVDYVAILERFGPGQTSGYVAASTERGMPCSGASDRDACLLIVEQRKKDLACSAGQCPNALLTTDGDEVASSLKREDLRALLGAIDDPDEAAALALFDGFTIVCGQEEFAGTRTRTRGDSIELDSEWEECSVGFFQQQLTVDSDGKVTDHGKTMTGKTNCVVGRRPGGLCLAPALRSSGALAAFFATTAQLEAASIHAFERLARELAALGAPAELIAAAARAALDEVRHARAIGMLARRAGATPSAPRVQQLPLRGPFAIALENAVEGCVRESFGALVAHHQALSARDPLVRALMITIAEDETRHAQLSWQVARWLEPRLPAAARDRLQLARAEALRQLAGEVDVGLSAHEAGAIGWPSPERTLALLDRFGRALGLG